MLSVVKKIIKDSGSEVVTSANIKLNKVFKNKVATSDLILVLGGDGTMIGSIRSLYNLKIPFLGINLGTVGFLTDLSTNKIEGLNEILKGNYIEEDRPVFETFSDNQKKKFLNEVVIHSGSVTKMLELELSIQDQVIYNIRADGLIISTSTGSAYLIPEEDL